MTTRDRDLVQLSKTISHALRHQPWLYELELDAEGWTPVADLLAALGRRRAAWRGLAEDDLARLVAAGDKRRFELRDGRVRALYGHSLAQPLLKTPAAPPPTLFHGTARAALPSIRAAGLRPMGRQYVHLSVDEETARQVGARKGGRPVVLTVLAGQAHRQGVAFYRGNAQVWLADAIPPRFIAEREE
jgi:putative RNA 2'-phosphotransferase